MNPSPDDVADESHPSQLVIPGDGRRLPTILTPRVCCDACGGDLLIYKPRADQGDGTRASSRKCRRCGLRWRVVEQ